MYKSIQEVVEQIIIERNKTVEGLILGEIQKMSTENGIDTKIVLNEKAIVSALEKQIPTKPIVRDLWQLGTADGHSCPNCGYDIPYTKQPKHCEECGQALDWSDVE